MTSLHSPKYLRDLVCSSEETQRVLMKKSGGSISVCCHRAEEHVAAHTAPHAVFLQMLDGQIEIKIAEHELSLKAGQVVSIPANVVREYCCLTDTQFLVVMLKDN